MKTMKPENMLAALKTIKEHLVDLPLAMAPKPRVKGEPRRPTPLPRVEGYLPPDPIFIDSMKLSLEIAAELCKTHVGYHGCWDNDLCVVCGNPAVEGQASCQVHRDAGNNRQAKSTAGIKVINRAAEDLAAIEREALEPSLLDLFDVEGD